MSMFYKPKVRYFPFGIQFWCTVGVLLISVLSYVSAMTEEPQGSAIFNHRDYLPLDTLQTNKFIPRLNNDLKPNGDDKILHDNLNDATQWHTTQNEELFPISDFIILNYS